MSHIYFILNTIRLHSQSNTRARNFIRNYQVSKNQAIPMESSAVSAFAIYKATNQIKPVKKQNKKKRKPRIRNKQQGHKVPNLREAHLELGTITENVAKEGAQKIKQMQKKLKENKLIGKKKTVKNKKSKDVKGNNNKNIVAKKSNTESSKERSTSESDNAPTLIPVQSQYFAKDHEEHSNEDTCSHSSCNSFDFTPVQTDSREEGLKAFKWMIAPYDPNEFLNRVWEKKPLYISRSKPGYYKEIISTPIIDDMLRNENIQFTKNIDVTSYVNEKRETHNPEGRAYPHLVWDYYLNGCSVRLLNPQTYIPKLHLLNATLQEFFNSFVGANAYLTPPDSQGFAPHYDDIEAFILQAEGKKHWRIYKPISENEVLPRVSSKNFDQAEIGEPIMEVTLEAGDMLYFPRGYIHQGVTIDGEHSLHITVSMYQKHSWADLFEKLIPSALEIAIGENVKFRRGLPFDIYDNFGIVNSEVNTPRRMEIEAQVKALFSRIMNYLPIDSAVDQMNKNYQYDALPPVLTDMEKAVTVHGDSDVMVENGKVVNRVEIGLDTRIRLLRKNVLRMVSEDQIRLYYHAENSLEYHANELSFIEIEEGMAPAIETLITMYPEYVAVENLVIPNDVDKLQLADALWGRGLIMTEYPLETIEDE